MAYEQLKLSNQVCFRLYSASRLITQAYEPYLRKLGITYTQYLVLMVLWEEDNQPINYIGKKLMLGINTMSPLIKRMEAMGIISRRDSESDKRKQIVYLTQKGKDMQEQASGVPGCMLDLLKDNGVEEERLFSLIPGLDSIIENMNEK